MAQVPLSVLALLGNRRKPGDVIPPSAPTPADTTGAMYGAVPSSRPPTLGDTGMNLPNDFFLRTQWNEGNPVPPEWQNQITQSAANDYANRTVNSPYNRGIGMDTQVGVSPSPMGAQGIAQPPQVLADTLGQQGQNTGYTDFTAGIKPPEMKPIPTMPDRTRATDAKKGLGAVGLGAILGGLLGGGTGMLAAGLGAFQGYQQATDKQYQKDLLKFKNDALAVEKENQQAQQRFENQMNMAKLESLELDRRERRALSQENADFRQDMGQANLKRSTFRDIAGLDPQSQAVVLKQMGFDPTLVLKKGANPMDGVRMAKMAMDSWQSVEDRLPSGTSPLGVAQQNAMIAAYNEAFPEYAKPFVGTRDENGNIVYPYADGRYPIAAEQRAALQKLREQVYSNIQVPKFKLDQQMAEHRRQIDWARNALAKWGMQLANARFQWQQGIDDQKLTILKNTAQLRAIGIQDKDIATVGKLTDDLYKITNQFDVVQVPIRDPKTGLVTKITQRVQRALTPEQEKQAGAIRKQIGGILQRYLPDGQSAMTPSQQIPLVFGTNASVYETPEDIDPSVWNMLMSGSETTFIPDSRVVPQENPAPLLLNPATNQYVRSRGYNPSNVGGPPQKPKPAPNLGKGVPKPTPRPAPKPSNVKSIKPSNAALDKALNFLGKAAKKEGLK